MLVLEAMARKLATTRRLGRPVLDRVDARLDLAGGDGTAHRAIEDSAIDPDSPDLRIRRHILILVENLSVPSDRRVWQESRALVEAGFKVTVICPVGVTRDRESETVIDGVRILRYPLRPAAGAPLGYAREYAFALWHTLRLAIKVRRAGRIDAVQACNPPDRP